MNFTIEGLTAEEVNEIGIALSQRPYIKVVALMAKIQSQVKSQETEMKLKTDEKQD